MSGHSKWSTIKRKKGKADAERGKIFTRLIKEITVAARQGGGDPAGNARLRTAIASAKLANMPAANIERAIKKGTGELPGTVYEEFTYEGYGPAGVAVFLEVMSDNKNRTTSELRHVFSRHGGNLGEAGCVAWLFAPKGVITIARNAVEEDRLLEVVLDGGGEDVNHEADDAYEVYTSIADLEPVARALEAAQIPIQARELSRIPQTRVMLEEADAIKLMKLLDALEDHDDVQKVYANFDTAPEIMERLKGS
jgi:YebC/PmpR family DNA-binding regulatory protein